MPGVIAEAAYEHTGRQVEFSGPARASLLPFPGVVLHGIRVSNREGFGSGPMLLAGRCEIALDWLPLLAGEMRLRHILIEEPSVNLIRRADGATNWDDVVARMGGGAYRIPDDGRALVQGLSLLAIHGLEIREGEVTLVDEGPGRSRVELRDFKWYSGSIIKGGRREVRAAGVAALFPQNLTAEWGVRGFVELSREVQHLSFQEFQGFGSGERYRVDVEVADGHYDLESLAAHFESLRLVVQSPDARDKAGDAMRDTVSALPFDALNTDIETFDLELAAGGYQFTGVAFRGTSGGLETVGEIDAIRGNMLDRWVEIPRLTWRSQRAGTGRTPIRGEIGFGMTLPGETPEEMLRSARGEAALTLHDGDLSVFIPQLGATIAGSGRPSRSENQTHAAPGDVGGVPITQFDRLEAKLQLGDGLLRSSGFEVSGSGWRIEGSGILRMTDASVDIRLLTTLGAGGGSVLTVPLRLAGPVSNPQLSLDLSSVFHPGADGSGQ